jgi:hypothetical protein
MPAQWGRQKTICTQKGVIAMKIDHMPVGELRPYPNNARTHSKRQVRQIANSIQKFGFCNPVLIDDEKPLRRLLRVHTKRPRGRRAAEKGDELTSPHIRTQVQGRALYRLKRVL